jgi:hypothetical protein
LTPPGAAIVVEQQRARRHYRHGDRFPKKSVKGVVRK